MAQEKAQWIIESCEEKFEDSSLSLSGDTELYWNSKTVMSRIFILYKKSFQFSPQGIRPISKSLSSPLSLSPSLSSSLAKCWLIL